MNRLVIQDHLFFLGKIFEYIVQCKARIVILQTANHIELSTPTDTLVSLGDTLRVTVIATDANGVLMGYREIEDFDASEPDVAFGLYTKSALAASAGDPTDFVAMSQNTKGSDNIHPPEVGPILMSTSSCATPA